MAKLPSFVYSRPFLSAPAFFPPSAAAASFAAGFGFFSAFGAFAAAGGAAAAAGAAPKSTTAGSCLKWVANLTRSAGATATVMSLRSGWTPTFFAPCSFASSTSFTAPPPSLITASGVTAPCTTSSFSVSVFSSAKRNAAPGVFSSAGSDFMFTAVSCATVSRKQPAFLSLTKRFFANTQSRPPTAARPASTVVTGSCDAASKAMPSSEKAALTLASAIIAERGSVAAGSAASTHARLVRDGDDLE